MARDLFAIQGEQFRRKTVKDMLARQQGVEALIEIADLCENGIDSFYSGDTPNLIVERVSDSQLSVRFGYRPGKGAKENEVLAGPCAVVFLTPEGKLLWAESDGWGQPDQLRPYSRAVPLDAHQYTDTITARLIAFLSKGEKQYERAAAWSADSAEIEL
ncbi:MAG: hypothetical protein SFU86_10210 [Pirellulaceae bacterium]|nr:hypothetical protein [Pirellulaceae bacterium]